MPVVLEEGLAANGRPTASRAPGPVVEVVEAIAVAMTPHMLAFTTHRARSTELRRACRGRRSTQFRTQMAKKNKKMTAIQSGGAGRPGQLHSPCFRGERKFPLGDSYYSSRPVK